MLTVFVAFIYLVLILVFIRLDTIKKESEKQTQILKDILEELKRGKNV